MGKYVDSCNIYISKSEESNRDTSRKVNGKQGSRKAVDIFDGRLHH